MLLAVAGGAPAEVTALFAGLALFRAPYTLAVGLVAALTGRLTTLVVQGRRAALRRFRRPSSWPRCGSPWSAGSAGGLARTAADGARCSARGSGWPAT